MTITQRFWRFLGTPFRAIVALTFTQVRSLFSIAMLCGIISLSAENWTYMALAHHAVEKGEVVRLWFDLLVERTRYNSGLQAWFAIIMGLVVFGAEFVRAKWGDKEVGFGKKQAPSSPQQPDEPPLELTEDMEEGE